LPGGQVILYTVVTGVTASEFRIDARPLAGGPAHTVIEDASDGRYVPTGHLVFARGGALFAAPFDLDRAQITSGAVSVLGDVMHAPSGRGDDLRTGAAQVVISASGNLAYLKGGVPADPIGNPAWIESGTVQPIGAVRASYLRPRLSPDGRRFLVISRGQEQTLWVYRVADGGRLRIPFNGSPQYAEWLSNSMLAVSGMVRGVTNIYRVPVDGSGAPERLTSGATEQIVTSVASDGSELIYLEGGDIWALPLPAGPSRRLLETPEREISATLSPDRKWIAYETGNNVFVRSYPELRAPYPVLGSFSRQPRWSRTGRGLFFWRVDEKLPFEKFHVRHVDIAVKDGAFTTANLRTIWSGDQPAYMGGLITAGFDIDNDDRRILAVAVDRPIASPARAIHIVTNWFDELKARIAATR
jgi:serine/threonine-protein kinase